MNSLIKRHKKMTAKARQLGYANSYEAEQSGHSEKLKKAFNNTK